MIKNFNTLADRLKGIKIAGKDITPEELISALTGDNEVEIEVGKINLFTDEQLTELKTNFGKDKYEEGKLAGGEIYAKELKKHFGLDGQPGKSIETVAKYVQDKIITDAKLPEEQKVKELSTSLTQLQQKYQTDSEAWKNQLLQKDNEVKTIKNKSFLSEIMPKVDGYKQKHILAAFEADGYGIQIDENNKVIPTLNGKPIKNQLEDYEDANAVVTNWLSQSGYLKSEQGRGGGNNNGAGFSEFKTENDVFKYMEKNKIDPGSSLGQDILKKFEESKK